MQLLGLALLVVGCLLKFNADFVTSKASDLLTEIRLDDLNIDLSSVLNSIALIFIIAGAFILLVGFLGCAGACCKFRPLLVIVSTIWVWSNGDQRTVKFISLISKRSVLEWYRESECPEKTTYLRQSNLKKNLTLRSTQMGFKPKRYVALWLVSRGFRLIRIRDSLILVCRMLVSSHL